MDELSTDFDEIQAQLEAADALLGAAECQGMLCGVLCANGAWEPDVWLEQIAGSDLEELSPGHPLLQLIGYVWEDAARQLDAEDFSFTPLLPQDDRPLADRARSLGEWCQGFLFGFGASIAGVANVPPRSEEFLRDLREFCRIDDGAVGDEEDEVAYAELVEYLRAGAVMLREEAVQAILQTHESVH